MYIAVGINRYKLTNYFHKLLRGVRTSRLHQSVRHAAFHVLERSVDCTASVRRAADIQSWPCVYAYTQVPYPLLECFQLWMGIHTWHIDQCFETPPGGVRTSRLDWDLPDVSFYIPEVISQEYSGCTERCGPPNVNRIDKYRWWNKFLKLLPDGMQAICWNLWAPDRPFYRPRSLKARILTVQKK